jgi:hypothetical protein
VSIRTLTSTTIKTGNMQFGLTLGQFFTAALAFVFGCMVMLHECQTEPGKIDEKFAVDHMLRNFMTVSLCMALYPQMCELDRMGGGIINAFFHWIGWALRTTISHVVGIALTTFKGFAHDVRQTIFPNAGKKPRNARKAEKPVGVAG